MLDDLIRSKLSDLPVPELRIFDSLPSSNDEALAWASKGAPDGSLVIADQQTSGRGRLGRVWVTAPGAAIALSMVLRPTPSEIDIMGLFSPLGALAVCQALEQGYGLAPRIKWPNDVLLNGAKVCGVLAEAYWNGQNLNAVVLGIGINVARESVPPADQLRYPAACIEEFTNRSVERWDLLRRVVTKIFSLRQKLGSPDFQQAWQERLAFINEVVIIDSPDGRQFSGRMIGVDHSGSLRLLGAEGEEKLITAGDVSLRPGSQSNIALGG